MVPATWAPTRNDRPTHTRTHTTTIRPLLLAADLPRGRLCVAAPCEAAVASGRVVTERLAAWDEGPGCCCTLLRGRVRWVTILTGSWLDAGVRAGGEGVCEGWCDSLRQVWSCSENLCACEASAQARHELRFPW